MTKSKLVLSIMTIALTAMLFIACSNSNKNSADTKSDGHDSTMTHDEIAYACPMHPEETGHKGDKCPKCGMDLEEVK